METYKYISRKTGCDPAKTIFLCPPDKFSDTLEHAEQFANQSGWIDQVEDDGAVLIVPIIPEGWGHAASGMLKGIYLKDRNEFKAPVNETLPGRNGSVWLWETQIYVVGYQEGADFSALEVIGYPDVFAASALIELTKDIAPTDNIQSDHWYVENPSEDYSMLNENVPVSVWLFDEKHHDALLKRFCHQNETDEIMNRIYEDITCTEYSNSNNFAASIRVTDQSCGSVAMAVMHTLFDQTIRWKNSPTGTLSRHVSREDFFHGGRYIHDEVESDGEIYPFALYLPRNCTLESAEGLPVVFSIHGRGEPAWMFATKNGWEQLSDETEEFVVVLPDSPQNIWNMNRDRNSISVMINKLVGKYHFDETRIYLTGFSNGAIFTVQQCSTFPKLFAAVSPWNGPYIITGTDSMAGDYSVFPGFTDSGYEMPLWICAGDHDNKASVKDMQRIADSFLQVNGCDSNSFEKVDSDSNYTKDKGYHEGARFSVTQYKNRKGSVRVCTVVMKNMPHGAIVDQSRMSWEFMKRFSRKDSKSVCEQ